MNKEVVKSTATGLTKFKNPVDFFVEFSPSKCLAKMDVNNVSMAIKAEVPSLAQIKKAYGAEVVQSYIKLWLIDINEYMDFKRPMSELQIEQCAILIYNDNPFLNIADFHVFFTRLKKGQYGTLYESLNGAKLISLLEQYVKERMQCCYDETLQNHENLKYKDEKQYSLEAKIKAEAKKNKSKN